MIRSPGARWRPPGLGGVLLVLAGYALGCILTGQPRAAWQAQVGDHLGDSPYYAVAYDPGQAAWLAGAYTTNGEATVGRSGDGLLWDATWATAAGPVESVSGFISTGGTTYALSEAGVSPAVYRVPTAGGALEATWAAERLDMYLLAGSSSAAAGVVCVGSNRDVGGYLATVTGEVLTPALRDVDGWPLFAWDAAQVGGQWVAATSRGRNEYHDPWAGRLAVLEGGTWRITSYSGAGIVQIATLAADPGALYLCTTYGEIQRTTDMERFVRVFQGEAGSDIRLWDIDGRPVAVSAAGVVYDTWQEAARLDGAEFLALAPGPGHVLGGVINRDDGAWGVRLTW